MKNKFLQSCIGISIVIFAIGFLIRSISPAKAEIQKSEINFPQETNKIGKYMMAYQMVEHYNDRPEDTGNNFHNVQSEILVWDTETGKSRLFYIKGGKWVAYVNSQLPSNPLE